MSEKNDTNIKNNAYLPFQFDEKLPSYKRHVVTCDKHMLGGIVSCFYDLNFTDMKKKAFPVLPDGCTDLIFFPNESFSNTIVIRSGVKMEFYSYDMLVNRHAFGVRFLPGGFERIFGCWKNMSHLRHINEFLNISDLKLNVFYDVTTEMDFEDKVSLFEKIYFRHVSHDYGLEDTAKICNLFIKSQGMYSLKNLENDFYLSNRQLRRVFKHYLGYGLKEMLDIIRFQFIIRGCVENSFRISQRNVAEYYGFSDEFQLSRFCKRMTGLSFTRMRDVLF